MLGFTHNELRVVFFLIVALLVGMGFRLHKQGARQAIVPAASTDSSFVAVFQTKAAELNLADKRGAPQAAVKRAEKTSSSERERGSGVGLLIDVNTATASELERLPKVGPVLARKIVEHRDEHGSFRQIHDLVKVRGIGEATLQRLRPHLEPIK